MTTSRRPPPATGPSTIEGRVEPRPGPAATWHDVLDSITAQVDLQERCVRLGHAPPPDLEIDEPDEPLAGNDRLRAVALFERCEALALEAAKSLASTRHGLPSAYAGSTSSVASALPASFA